MVLSVEETAQLLGCKRSKVFELLSEGILERAPRYGRSLRIYRASVERALQPAPVRGRKRRTVSADAIPVATTAGIRAAMRR